MRRPVAVVSFSGGASSWLAARLVRDEEPDREMVLLFADTLIEDFETYQFLDAAAENIGVPVTRIADGRTPWEVFRDERFLGNSNNDPCSKILKRKLLRKWIDDRYAPEEAAYVVGIDANEAHRRLPRIEEGYAPRRIDAPLVRHGIWKEDVHRRVEEAGLPRQRLYALGLPHANCGGGCVKMGMTGWALLLRKFPCRFQEWEENEQKIRDHLGKDVSILKDRRGGTSTPMTLRQFRERLEAGRLPLPREPEIGGCGCALD